MSHWKRSNNSKKKIEFEEEKYFSNGFNTVTSKVISVMPDLSEVASILNRWFWTLITIKSPWNTFIHWEEVILNYHISLSKGPWHTTQKLKTSIAKNVHNVYFLNKILTSKCKHLQKIGIELCNVIFRSTSPTPEPGLLEVQLLIVSLFSIDFDAGS